MEKMSIMFVFVFLMVGVSAAEVEGTFYTDNFYISLGLIVLALIIIGIFVWLWARGPINRWASRPARAKVPKPVSQHKKSGLGRFLK